MIYEHYMVCLNNEICSEELLDFEFEHELLTEYNVSDTDKGSLAYELAAKWSKECKQNSHSAKYYKIECIYKDIIELI